MQTITIHTLKDYVELSASRALGKTYLVADDEDVWLSEDYGDKLKLGDGFPHNFEELVKASFDLLGIRVHIT